MELQLLKKYILYNPETGFFKRKLHTGRAKKGDIINTEDSEGYIFVNLFNKRYRASRLAWFYYYGYWPTFVDHINGVRNDNRILNLREVNKSENSQNRLNLSSLNTSGFSGVSKRGNKWQANIKLMGKKFYLGVYKTPEEAYKVYLSKKKDIHISTLLSV